MAKKIFKIILILLSISAVILGVFYFIQNYKQKDDTFNDIDNNTDHLEAKDALDLSSFKFSRHYIKLK